MKFYQRKSDGKFPCYEKEVATNGADKYREVIDETPSYDQITQRLGKWSSVEPRNVDGDVMFFASRDVLDKPQSVLDAMLEKERQDALDTIDMKAGDARAEIAAKGQFLDEEYRIKGEQADAFLADPTLTADDVPMIFANVGTSDGDTPEAVATLYSNNKGLYTVRISQIAAIRRAAKDAVIAASDILTIRQIVADLNYGA